MFSKIYFAFILIGLFLPKIVFCFDDSEGKSISKLTIPKASSFFSGDYLEEKSPDELKTLYGQGLMKLSSSPSDAMQIFAEGARHGYAPAMLTLGHNAQDLTEKLHYYIIAFETYWLQTGEHYKQALLAMDKLSTTAAMIFSNTQKQVYWEHKKCGEAFFNIVHLYALNFELISFTIEDVKRASQKFLKQIQEKFKHGNLFLQYAHDSQCSPQNKSLFFIFAASLYKYSKKKESKYQLGVMYQLGEIGKKDDGRHDYQEAARCFRKSRMPQAKQNLGFLYVENLIRRKFKEEDFFGPYLSDQERYQEAAILFKESGTHEAKANLGSMYIGGMLRQKFVCENLGGPCLSEYESYQEAAKYFAESGIPLAEYNLGVLYIHSHLNIYLHLTDLERYQKSLDHFMSAFLRGVIQAKTMISDLKEFIKKEKERVAQIKEKERLEKKEERKRLKEILVSQQNISSATSSSTSIDGLQEAHTREMRAVPYIKTKQPKVSREERIQQLKDKIAEAKMIRISDVSQQAQTFPVRFATTKAREDFEIMQDDPQYMNKITELMPIIHQDPKGTQDSTGQCKPLKHHPDHYSRRINQKDRLVYIFDGKQITIVSCKGHYDDLMK